MKNEIPKGVKTFLPPAAAAKRMIEERLLGVFCRWGYREIVTPTLEYWETLSLGMGPSLQEKAYTLIDRETGRLLALRPDITPQIGRIAATSLRDLPQPLRLCYLSNVFRYVEPQVGRPRELFQAGVELIGLTSPEADVEMIAIAVESLRAVGLKEFRIAVSQVGFFRGLLEELALPPEEREQVKEAVQRKDRSTLERIADQAHLTPGQREILLRFPFLFGREEVLEEAERLVHNPASRAALANLSQIYQMLKVYRVEEFVILDLAELRGFDYYTGAVFEGFTRGLGYRICGGGRYDHLLGRYGADCPATGFALDVERVMLALGHHDPGQSRPPIDFLIIDFQPDKSQALALARDLREKGYRVARDIIRRGLEESLEYARSLQIARAIILGTPSAQPGWAVVREIASESEVMVEVERIKELWP
ncbi:MAG: ATP phosphoribosyltransferase regulatory subunit [Candidatus Tectomicrobia bacterium]|uniref:ATP phosphoribosyltransferase regulatory subunit n=1 Tax=Tectimicrobiota bacterium TaxID=2528274 RepID=A0A932FY05_UNCTE|nr:ATP phosphoribosyltransferase regulatory subunit [Candidatus Tectomicrobia bacterium]